MTLRNPQINKGNNLSSKVGAEKHEDWRRKNPVFSLRHTVSGYCVADCNHEQKIAFANTLLQLGKRTWMDIMLTDKHGSGSEKIPRKKMKLGIPAFVAEDQEFFTVVRFFGKCPMIGYVDNGIYYILWLDRNHDTYI